MKNTSLTIRAQARGGMFLGPDSFAGAVITIKDVKTNKVLASGFTDDGDSGIHSPDFSYDASPCPIITNSVPCISTYWVIATGTTVKFTTELVLKEPTLLEISARIPLPPEQGDQFVRATQWVLPKIGINTGPGYVLEVPGLWIQPEVVNNGNTIRVRAKVTMMCGCEINLNSPWLPNDFDISGTITLNKKDANFKEGLEFVFQENSQYLADIEVPQKGDYQIELNAFQKSTGNMGYAVTEVKYG